MMRRFRAAVACAAAFIALGLAWHQAKAQDEVAIVGDAMVTATELLVGEPLPGDEAALLRAQVAEAMAVDADRVTSRIAVIAEMAMAMHTVAHPASRAVIYEGLRMAMAEALLAVEAPVPLARFNEADPMLSEHMPGMGITAGDIVASAWLWNLHKGSGSPDDEITAADIAAQRVEVRQSFLEESSPNRLALSRVSSWAAGMQAVWPELTLEERFVASGIMIRTEVPSAEVTQRITGTDDFILWAVGVAIALTDEERAQYPRMVAFLEGGGTAKAAAELLERLYGGVSAEATYSEFQSLQMLQNLNNFYSNHGSNTGFDAGGVMMGLE